MSTAFQSNAFQTNAFQIEGVIAGAIAQQIPGNFQWKRLKKHGSERPAIDWNALQQERSDALKASIQELFFPKPAIEAVPREEVPTRSLASALEASDIGVVADYGELELLLLLA